MALRDYLNFESTADFADFVLQNGQAVAIVTMDGTTPLETWYYNANSLATPNGTTVFKPNAIDISSPGRYIKSITASSWTTTTSRPSTLSGYGITDAYPLTGNPSNYLTGVTQAQVNTALGFTPIDVNGARNAISITNNGVGGNATYNATTGVINVPNYSLTVYTGSAQVTSGGNTTYFLTSNGTATGTPLFNNVTFATPFVNDSNVNYTYGWTYNNTTKVLTVNTKSSTALTIAGASVLGIPNNVPAGTTVTVLVRGN